MYLKGVGVIEQSSTIGQPYLQAAAAGKKISQRWGTSKGQRDHDLFLAHQHQHARGHRGATPTSVVYASKMFVPEDITKQVS